MIKPKEQNAEVSWPQMQRRQHFRIVYPVGAQALFCTTLGDCSIIDISEQGIRFCPTASILKRFPTWLSGQLNLYCGDSLRVEGPIIRQGLNYMVLQLTKPIPYKLVHKEELLIIQKFRSKVKAWKRPAQN